MISLVILKAKVKPLYVRRVGSKNKIIGAVLKQLSPRVQVQELGLSTTWWTSIHYTVTTLFPLSK